MVFLCMHNLYKLSSISMILRQDAVVGKKSVPRWSVLSMSVLELASNCFISRNANCMLSIYVKTCYSKCRVELYTYSVF